MPHNNQGMIPVSQNFIEGSLKYIELTSECIKRAQDELGVLRSMQKKASDVRADTLAYLIKAGVIPKGQEKQAEAMLADHSLTYNLLKTAVDKFVGAKTQNKQAGDLGRSVSEKEAGLADNSPGYDSENDGYVGRRTSEKKASDIAILRVLESPK